LLAFATACSASNVPAKSALDIMNSLTPETLVQTMVQLRSAASTSSQLPLPAFEQELGVPSVVKHKVVHSYPHDRSAFTQGLFVHDGVMYESTGLYGESSVRKVDVKTGKVTQMAKFDERIFAEGITMHSDGKIYGLSWLEGLGFRIDPDTLKVEETFKLPVKEGWGITSDGKHLIVTDSTQTLTFLDSNFHAVKTVEIRDPSSNNKDVPFVNELEYIDGKVYGNVYGLDYIAVIDPKTGNVDKWVDCRGLWKGGARGSNNVLNGIAYDKEHKKLYVTGKKWSVLYEIETPQ